MERRSHVAGARDQRLADLPGPPVETGVDALQAIVEGVGETVGALREILRHLADARRDATLEASEPAFDGDLDRACRRGEADRRGFRAVRQAALESAEPGIERLADLCDPGVDERTER
jgi:hypothetical protein